MSIVTYPYKRWKGWRVPIITFGIRYRDKWFPVNAYVDSGATYSVFRARTATQIGLDYRTGKRQYIQGAGGHFLLIYLHDLELQIGQHRLVAPIGFSEKLGLNFNLLGRSEIFSHFKVCFDEKHYITTFTPHSK